MLHSLLSACDEKYARKEKRREASRVYGPARRHAVRASRGFLAADSMRKTLTWLTGSRRRQRVHFVFPSTTCLIRLAGSNAQRRRWQASAGPDFSGAGRSEPSAAARSGFKSCCERRPVCETTVSLSGGQ